MDRGISQQDLADRLRPPTTQSQIMRLEKGHRKLTKEWALRLADVLECHWIDLMSDDECGAEAGGVLPGALSSSDLMSSIGVRLLAVRKILGLTQEELSGCLGVNRTTYRNWETSERMPDPLALIRMADQFGVTLDWVYRGDLRMMPFWIASKIKEEQN